MKRKAGEKRFDACRIGANPKRVQAWLGVASFSDALGNIDNKWRIGATLATEI
jgi:hypothetical protein